MADVLTSAWSGTVNDLFKAIGDWLPQDYMLQVETEPFSGSSALRLVMSCPGANLSVSSRISREAMGTFAGDPKAIIWETVRAMKARLDASVEQKYSPEEREQGYMIKPLPQATARAVMTSYLGYGWLRDSFEGLRIDNWARPRPVERRPDPPRAKPTPVPEADIRPRRKLRIAEIA